MIDLEFDALPDTLVVDGEDVKVHTSFRVWLRFGRLLHECQIPDPAVLVEPCEGNWVPAALEFYMSENATPNGGGSTARTMDLALDGDYVVGSFQQAYGIDLTCGDMHWHRFLALLRSLPGDTKLVEIAGYRAWVKSKRSQESMMRELRNQWALPAKREELPVREEADQWLDKNEGHLRDVLSRR